MPLLSPSQQCQSTEGKISHSMDLLTPNLGVFWLCLWPLIAPGYLGAGLPCLSSALWCQYHYCSFQLLFGNSVSIFCAIYPLSRCRFLFKICLYWTPCLQTYQWGVKSRHFCHPEKLECKVCKHEVWWKIINVLEPGLSRYCKPKIMNIGSISFML